MRTFSLFFLAPLALGSIIPRDAKSVYDAISGIDAAVRKLTSALEAYQGGILESQPIFEASLAIHAVNRKGYAAANASPAFNAAESKQIVDHVNESVGLSIPISVKAIEAKKKLFDEAKLTSLVKATIDLLKSDHETFSLATGAKLALSQTSGGISGAGGIEAALQKASIYFAL
jgi:hypothetical protein